MLASRLHGLEDIRLDTVDDPDPGEGEVRVKVAHNGICGSDLHMYFRESPWRSGHPITLGHEFCGVVDGLGSGVSGVGLGTRVAVRPFYKCGGCARCKRGLEHLCTPMKVLGCGAEGGGLAEYCVMDAGMVFALPDAVTLEQGAAGGADGGVVQRRAARRRRAGDAHGRVRRRAHRRRRDARPARQGDRRRRGGGAVGGAARDDRGSWVPTRCSTPPPTTCAAR